MAIMQKEDNKNAQYFDIMSLGDFTIKQIVD